MLSTQKNVPVAKTLRKPRQRKYPFEEMAVGDMFFVPHRKKNNLTTHVSTVGKDLGKKFTTRLTHMRKTSAGKWEPCDPDQKDSVQGVGVWRTE